jgi:aldehyde:ferredoxin oxidoreductase
MNGGYTGKVLRVDLNKKTSTVEPLDYREAHRFIGGRGLAAKLLFDELPLGADPLGPENKLVLATGPLTGTLVPGSNRYVIVTKSPETNLFLDTYAGGDFSGEIKYAGYDLIIIEGKAEKPTYLWIDDSNVELREATHLWGKLTSETETSLKKEVGDETARVATIGPAGENLSNLAIVRNDYWHRCGRGGAGAVMGSKKLKAVVIRGSQGVKIDDPQGLMNYILTTCDEKITRGGMAIVATGLMKYGTLSGIPAMNATNILATRNFQQGQFEGVHEMDLDAVRSRIGVRDTSCLCCSIACCKFGRVKSGLYAGAKCGSLQQETHTLMGPNLGIDSEVFNVQINALCDDLGIDTVGAGAVIGFAMECYERGLLSQKDLDGIDLRFGSQNAVMKILPMMAYREGIGDLFAQGVKLVSQKIGQGSEEFAMHVKGLAYPAYRPGVSSLSFALAYAVADRGACHRRARPFMAERTLTPYVTDGRAELFKALYDERIPWHCALCCDLATCTVGLDFKDAASMFSYVIGWEFTEKDMQILADRVASLIRVYNMREGATRADDTLAPRSFQIETTGPVAGKVLTIEMLNSMLDEYYALRGWDREGVPTAATLSRLDLGDVVRELQKHGKSGVAK